MGLSIHIRRMGMPGAYTRWDHKTSASKQYLVDYLSRDEFDHLDFVGAIEMTNRTWRCFHIFGILIAVSWPSCSLKI